MRTRRTRWLWMFSLLALAGCLELEQTFVFAPDGSGTQTVHMTMPLQTVASLRAAGNAAATGVATDPLALFGRESVEAELKVAGLELRSHRQGERADVREVTLQAAFPGPGVLRRSPLQGTAGEWAFAAGPVPGTTQLTYWPQGKAAWEEARQRAAGLAEAGDAIAEEFLAKRREQLRGLDLRVRFELPGKVLRWTRNMRQVADQVVEARVQAADLTTPADLVRRLAPRFEVVFADPEGTFPVDDPR